MSNSLSLLRQLALVLAIALAAVACDPRDPSDPTPERSANDVAGTSDPAAQDRADRLDRETPPPGAGPMADVRVDAAPTVDARAQGAALSQDQALALLVAIDEHEIAVARQAHSKNVDGEVNRYAQMMIDDHTRNLDETRALGASAAAGSAQLDSLRAKGETELERLGNIPDQDYEAAYVDAMVKGHTDALDMLDRMLIPATTDDTVRSHLSATRDRVAEHLQQARELQNR